MCLYITVHVPWLVVTGDPWDDVFARGFVCSGDEVVGLAFQFFNWVAGYFLELCFIGEDSICLRKVLALIEDNVCVGFISLPDLNVLILLEFLRRT